MASLLYWIHWAVVLLVNFQIAFLDQSPNLFHNPDFEGELGSSWQCSQCDISRIDQPFVGQYAGHVQNRSSAAQGLRQTVAVNQSSNYAVSAYLRIPSHVKDYHLLRINVILHGSNQKRKRMQIATIFDVQENDGWVKIAGDFGTKQNTKSATVMFIVATHAVDYFVDTTSLTEIVHDPQWRQKADARIDKMRKGNLFINLRTTGSCPHEAQIKIQQTRAAFPLGAAMQQTFMRYKKYQQYFYSLFNWATPVNALKWRFIEKKEGELDFRKADALVQSLSSKGIPIRGHCLAWDKKEKVLSWMEGKNASEISRTVHRRIKYMVNRYSKVIHQWDVNNEIITQMWYEKATNNTQFTQAMFEEAHRLEPNAQLALNEYGIVSNGKYASAYRRKAAKFRANGVPVHIAGIQSHIGGQNYFDVDLFKHRLDVVAEAGVPIWITEFDLEYPNVVKRAQLVEDALRLYYSHPAVEGIVLWGFWNMTNDLGKRQASLVDGPDFIENKVGQAVRRLYRESWWTNINYNITDLESTQRMHFRPFHGDLNIKVMMESEQMWQGDVSLSRDQDKDIGILVNCSS